MAYELKNLTDAQLAAEYEASVERENALRSKAAGGRETIDSGQVGALDDINREFGFQLDIEGEQRRRAQRVA